MRPKQLLVRAKRGNNKELMVKLALLANVERGDSVYLPNAYSEISDFITPHEFAGHLGSLSKIGFYKPESAGFGRIL